jgi:hypothetical protein
MGEKTNKSRKKNEKEKESKGGTSIAVSCDIYVLLCVMN